MAGLTILFDDRHDARLEPHDPNIFERGGFVAYILGQTMRVRGPRQSSRTAKPYRRAAICGLSNYRKLPLLSHVKYDLVKMRHALIRSGFDLDDSFMIRCKQEGGQGFLEWLAVAFGGAPKGAVLLLHLCGHGMRLGSEWIFCFEDFNPANVPTQTYYCIGQAQLVLFAQHTLVKPQLVIVGVDACNNDPRSHTIGLKTLIANLGKGPPLSDGTLVMVFGAKAGQKVSSVRGHGGHFTSAWSEAIDPRNPSRSLREAIDFAKKKVPQLCKLHKSKPIQVVEAIPSRDDPESMALEIFEHHPPNVGGPSAQRGPKGPKGAKAVPAPATAASGPADADFPYVDLLAHDGNLVRLIHSMEPAISGRAAADEIALMKLLSKRIEQLRQILHPNEVESN